MQSYSSRSVTVLCMLYNIKSNPVHPLCGAVPLPYVPARVTRGALVAHRPSFVSSHCKTYEHRRTFVPPLYVKCMYAFYEGNIVC